MALKDDYPSRWKNAPQDSLVDDWGMYNRECTSWCAWKLHKKGYNIVHSTKDWNANRWDDNARAIGITVNKTPEVGAIAQWDSNHVAYVEAVNGNDVTLSEYNYAVVGGYHTRTVAKTAIQNFIHFIKSKPVVTNPPKGGDDVITSDDINILRAGMRDVKGWNAKNVDAGKNDIAELAAWVDKTWEQYFTEAIKEGASWRKRRDAALSYYATKAATDKKVATLTLSVKTLTSQNKSLSDVNKQLSAQADIDAEEIANLEKQLSAKPTAVDEKVVVENWLVRLWNSLFKR